MSVIITNTEQALPATANLAEFFPLLKGDYGREAEYGDAERPRIFPRVFLHGSSESFSLCNASPQVPSVSTRVSIRLRTIRISKSTAIPPTFPLTPSVPPTRTGCPTLESTLLTEITTEGFFLMYRLRCELLQFPTVSAHTHTCLIVKYFCRLMAYSRKIYICYMYIIKIAIYNWGTIKIRQRSFRNIFPFWCHDIRTNVASNSLGHLVGTDTPCISL